MSAPENYDEQAAAYAAFSDESFSWNYLERPAIDAYLSPLYRDDVVVLDIGCGNGRIVRHLLTEGIEPDNIVGVDPSSEQLARAQSNTPGGTFTRARSEELPFSPGSFDLITSVMMMHTLDSGGLLKTLREANRALVVGGLFFYLDTNPDQDPKNPHPGEWVTKQTPWGTEVDVFEHDYHNFLREIVPFTGFTDIATSQPAVLREGKAVDRDEYHRYISKKHRVAGLLRKIQDI